MTCKHWDCGWCYHPSAPHYYNGCVGFDVCKISEEREVQPRELLKKGHAHMHAKDYNRKESKETIIEEEEAYEIERDDPWEKQGLLLDYTDEELDE